MPDVKFKCPACGQHLEAPEDTAGQEVPCPSCQAPLRVPAAASAPAASGATADDTPLAGLCPFCQSPVKPGEPRSPCPVCGAGYHTECWQENGGCAVYGCTEVPPVEPRHGIEIPISFWGRENKPCPRCGTEILAAAVRCRLCGATFSSARPEDSEEFRARAAREERLPGIKRTVTWLFVLSVLPCCVPIGAIWGLAWYPSHRDDVRTLPSIYPALCKIALAAALGQCVMLVLMAALYAAIRGS